LALLAGVCQSLAFFGLGSGEDADHRRVETCGDFDPDLGQLNPFRAHGLVCRGEIILHARAADDDASIMHVALHLVHVAVSRCLGIAGEKIAGEVHRLDVVLGAKVAHAEEIDALGCVRHVRIQLFEE